MKLTEAKLKQLIVETLNESKNMNKLGSLLLSDKYSEVEMGIELGLSMNPPAVNIYRGPKTPTGKKGTSNFYFLSSNHVNILDRDLAEYMVQNFQTRKPNYRAMAQGIPLDPENLRTSIYGNTSGANANLSNLPPNPPYLIFLYSHYEAPAPTGATVIPEPISAPTNSYSSPNIIRGINEVKLHPEETK